MKKYGFTLIELLAVIIVLGVLSLIAVGAVKNLQNDAASNTFVASNKAVVKSIVENCRLESQDLVELTRKYTITDGVISPKINLKGKSILNGIYHVNDDCEVKLVTCNDNYKYVESYGDLKGDLQDIYGSCNEEEVYPNATLREFVYDEETEKFVGDDLAFRSDEYNDKIAKINFVNHKNGGVYAWDLSDKQNGAVVGWLDMNSEDPNLYDLYIGSDSIIKGNVYSPYLFANFPNLKEIYVDFLDGSTIKDAKYMFSDIDVNTIDFSSFNTVNITNMKGMFSDSTIDILNLNYFNTTKVVDMSYMFDHYSGNLNISRLDTSNVTDMKKMFYYFYNNNINVNHYFDTSNVTNMESMFEKANLSHFDVIKFDTSNVVNMKRMFNESHFNDFPFSTFDTSKVVDMSFMFKHSNFNDLDLSSFKTNKVTNMEEMFSSMSFLNTLNIDSFNTYNVTNMNEMFKNFNNITTLNLSSFNTSKVTTANRMFNDSDSLETVYVGRYWDINEYQFDIFYGCDKLNSVTIK